MIPVRLELVNFLCYRQPAPLDFSGIRIACLAGDNGAGKSSLVDAITWALWGRARARRDDELIHLGQEEMRVDFTFELEGIRYRVLRQRTAGKRGRSLLDLQIAEDGGHFRSINESTIRETQLKLNQLLRLDYDTFVNSAFLLQGRADEFTVKTAGERKQILSDILGLSQWERYEERAKEHIRTADQRIAAFTARLEEIDRELSLEDQYRSDLAEAQARSLHLSDVLREAEAQLRQVQSARQDLGHKQQQLFDLERRLVQREQELAGVADELAQVHAQVVRFEAILAQAQEIELGHNAWTHARAGDATFNALLAQQNVLLERRRGLEAALADARSELMARHSALNQQVLELERRAAGSAVAADLEQVRAELKALAEQETQREALQLRMAALREEAGERRANNTILEAKGAELNERLDKLQDIAEARCPFCGQELSDAHRSELLVQLESERTAMRTVWRENQARARELADEVASLQGHLDRAATALKRMPGSQRREAELAQRLVDAEQATAQLAGVRAELAQAQARLEGGDYAPEARAELETLRGQLDELGYDAQAHHHAQKTLAEYAGFEARYAELAQARAEIPAVCQAQTRLAERQARWEQALDDDRAGQKVLEVEIDQLQAQLSDAAQIEAHADEVRRQESEARMRLGAARQRLDACEALKKQREECQAELVQLAEGRAIYEELRVAFSKKGVPAMIIEAAVPEIEDSANSLLTRMTAGRMHVRFETQREKVTGGLIETLDIQISDELGTRSYELYSGGEAFRINFAIRIALSQLLARRAGARLRTLVMDEGFGTQDAQGRERLVEAITAVQSDFDRILVITHLDELKDAFPARIEVTKTAYGSQIEVF